MTEEYSTAPDEVKDLQVSIKIPNVTVTWVNPTDSSCHNLTRVYDYPYEEFFDHSVDSVSKTMCEDHTDYVYVFTYGEPGSRSDYVRAYVSYPECK